MRTVWLILVNVVINKRSQQKVSRVYFLKVAQINRYIVNKMFRYTVDEYMYTVGWIDFKTRT